MRRGSARTNLCTLLINCCWLHFASLFSPPQPPILIPSRICFGQNWVICGEKVCTFERFSVVCGEVFRRNTDTFEVYGHATLIRPLLKTLWGGALGSLNFEGETSWAEVCFCWAASIFITLNSLTCDIFSSAYPPKCKPRVKSFNFCYSFNNILMFFGRWQEKMASLNPETHYSPHLKFAPQSPRSFCSKVNPLIFHLIKAAAKKYRPLSQLGKKQKRRNPTACSKRHKRRVNIFDTHKETKNPKLFASSWLDNVHT